MKVIKIFVLSFVFLLYKNSTIVHCGGYGDIAATSALQTVIKEPITLTIKDLYEHGVKSPITKLVHKIKKFLRYRKVLRWSRIWWILLVREIVGDNNIEKRTEKELREIWDQCTIAVFNNTLNTIDTKPLLFLHGILNECKENFSTKLRQDPSLIVVKMNQIIKSEIYRFWVSENYLKIARSGIFYKSITPSIVPPLPKEHTLRYLSSYMVDKLKALESKKNIESGKYEIDISSDEKTKKGEGDVDETTEDNLYEQLIKEENIDELAKEVILGEDTDDNESADNEVTDYNGDDNNESTDNEGEDTEDN
ncbi:exported protein 2, putative [Plasmodium relictum]|uniref:Exported protein 2, putative n=1 Tax=Plasmodium relictum TaxID=85471 RepID=A0A1J1HCR4_PLARL|nr:exported protein 2, putative [Plasmodium relictum]CRH01212.1 exported protein 2, putative [Plasmodium relictum]